MKKNHKSRPGFEPVIASGPPRTPERFACACLITTIGKLVETERIAPQVKNLRTEGSVVPPSLGVATNFEGEFGSSCVAQIADHAPPAGPATVFRAFTPSKSELNSQISNRHTPRLESHLTATKQTMAPRSNRHIHGGTERHICKEISSQKPINNPAQMVRFFSAAGA
jgi:hypothetical protein